MDPSIQRQIKPEVAGIANIQASFMLPTIWKLYFRILSSHFAFI